MRDIETVISLDMRAPSRAIPTQERYQAAVEMAVFVDAIGVDRTRLTEHHGSDDGYLPSRPSVIKPKLRLFGQVILGLMWGFGGGGWFGSDSAAMVWGMVASMRSKARR